MFQNRFICFIRGLDRSWFTLWLFDVISLTKDPDEEAGWSYYELRIKDKLILNWSRRNKDANP